jgi:hypothetical protein
MRTIYTFLFLVGLFGFLAAPASAQAAKAGDDEGEFYGGKWPADVPKPDVVEYHLPFSAGSQYAVTPSAAHNDPTNRNAVDWAMPIGTPILAAADGWVTKIRQSGPDGGSRQNSLLLQHANGQITMYLHLKHRGVVPKLGDFVRRGDVVAYSGNTGGGFAHLHFSVNEAGNLLSNPITFVEGSPSAKSQNVSFEEQFAKEMAVFSRARLALGFGRLIGMWDSAIEIADAVDELRPSDDANPRIREAYDEISATAAGVRGEADAWLGEIPTLMETDPAAALERIEIGLLQFKKSDAAASLKGWKDEMKSREDYKALNKAWKKSLRSYKDLRKVWDKEFEGASAQKVVKDYLRWAKKYDNHRSTSLVAAHVDQLLQGIR